MPMNKRTGYPEQEIAAAARDLGVTVDLSSLVQIADARTGETRYDLRATIRELSRRADEQHRRHRGAMGFLASHPAGMSAYERSGWEDHADGYLFDASEAKRTALDLAAVEREILGRPRVLDLMDATSRLYRWLDDSGYDERDAAAVAAVIESNELDGKPHAELLDLVEVMVDHEEHCGMFDPPSDYLLALHAALRFVRCYVGLDDGECTGMEGATSTEDEEPRLP